MTFADKTPVTPSSTYYSEWHNNWQPHRLVQLLMSSPGHETILYVCMIHSPPPYWPVFIIKNVITYTYKNALSIEGAPHIHNISYFYHWSDGRAIATNIKCGGSTSRKTSKYCPSHWLGGRTLHRTQNVWNVLFYTS